MTTLLPSRSKNSRSFQEPKLANQAPIVNGKSLLMEYNCIHYTSSASSFAMALDCLLKAIA